VGSVMTRSYEPDPETLPEVLDTIWQTLGRGVADRRHGFHHPVIANLGRDGMPQSRIVILRGADRGVRTVRFHTDIRSEKWISLLDNPLVSATLYDAPHRIQLRISGRAMLHHLNEEAEAAWNASQRMSRACYGTLPDPGSIISERTGFKLPEDDTSIAAGYENFGAVIIAIMQFEWLFLHHAGHRRARFDLTDNSAQWLVP
jgi:pyridoxamine 5'-phosphate oxidase